MTNDPAPDRDGAVVRNGRLYCWRTGPPRPVPQRDRTRGYRRRNVRAPEARGFWAFPFPYFAPGYDQGQRELLLPKRARLETARRIEDDIASGVVGEDDGRALLDRFWVDREAVLEAASGPPQRSRFWVAGELYCRFAPNGGHAFFLPGNDDWFLVTVDEFHRRLRKNRIRDTDFYEVFLGRGAKVFSSPR